MRKFLAFALASIVLCTLAAPSADGGRILGWIKDHKPVRSILKRVLHPFKHGGGDSEGEGYSEEVPAPRQAEPVKPAPRPNPPPRQKKIELSPTEVDGQPSVSYFQALFAKQQSGQYVNLANEESKATVVEEPQAEQVQQQEECSPQEEQQVQYRPRRRIGRRGGC